MDFSQPHGIFHATRHEVMQQMSQGNLSDYCNVCRALLTDEIFIAFSLRPDETYKVGPACSPDHAKIVLDAIAPEQTSNAQIYIAWTSTTEHYYVGPNAKWAAGL
jgi:hypothetical protein